MRQHVKFVCVSCQARMVMPRERRLADPVEMAYQVVQRATRAREDDGCQPRQRVIFDVTGPPQPDPDMPVSEDEQ